MEITDLIGDLRADLNKGIKENYRELKGMA